MTMNQNITEILKLLNNHNHEAYVVGGFVRDYLLHRNSFDVDITTSASREELLEILASYKPYIINKIYDTVTVSLNEYKIEITPYRIDGQYLNHRHPSSIQRSTSLIEDLSRRDFTINAIVMDAAGNIIDPLNGIKDLEKGIIKAIGNPERRFEEDALRILRAIRFKARLGFNIEPATQKAIYLKKDLLKNISMFRIQSEIIETIRYDKNVIDEYHEVYSDILNLDVSMNLDTDNETLLWALMLHNQKEAPDKLLISKKQLKDIRKLISHDKCNDYTIAFSDFDDPSLYIDYIYHLKGLDLHHEYQQLKDYIVNRNSLAIKASELMKLGYHGNEISQCQKMLINDIQRHKLKNQKEDIIRYLHMI